MTRATADLLLLAAALIWGLAFVGQSTAMAHMGPLTFTGARFLLAALVVAPFAVAEGRARPAIPRGRLVELVGIGAVFFLGAALQQWALLRTTVTNAGFLTALYVVMVPALGLAARKPKELPAAPARLVWPAALLSLAGTFLLGGGRLDGLNRGDMLVIVSAFFWALQIIALGALAYGLRRPLALAFTQYAVTAALGLGAGFLLETPSLAGMLAAWRELLYTGIVSGGLAFTLQAVAQAHTPPADAAIIVSMESVFAAGFGALMLGDRLSFMGWTGAGLVLASALLVQLAPIYLRRRRS